MVMNANDVRDFVLNYFSLIGAHIEPHADEVYRVELNEEQSAEMEGRMVNQWNKQAHGGLVTHYFAFHPEPTDPHEDIEYVTVGSHRLHQIIAAVRRRGEVTQLWLPRQNIPAWSDANADPFSSVKYRPFYLFLLSVEKRPDTRAGNLVHLAVDLVDGLPLYHIAHIVPKMRLRWGVPRDDTTEIERPTIDVDEAFHIAYDDIINMESEKDVAWAETEIETVERERKRLESFYRQKESEGHNIDIEKDKRLGELERLSPGIVVRPLGLTHAHLPVRHVNGSIRYLPEGFSHTTH